MIFDKRHKWGPPVHVNATVQRTCAACGRTDSMEKFVPDSFVDELLRFNTFANPYRGLTAKWRDDESTYFTVETA